MVYKESLLFATKAETMSFATKTWPNTGERVEIPTLQIDLS